MAGDEESTLNIGAHLTISKGIPEAMKFARSLGATNFQYFPRNPRGGASANNLMMQFQADILDVPVMRPKNIETTALGAAMLAGIGIGMWDMNRLREMAAIDHRFGPQFVKTERDAYLDRYKSAVRCVCGHAC